MSRFWALLIFLCLAFSGSNLSEAKKHHNNKEKKLSPAAAAVVGTVYCDACFRQDLPTKATHFIPGASVELVCKDKGSPRSFHKQAETDRNGRFKIDLPFSVSKHVKRIKNCSVKLIKSGQQLCSIAAAAESSSSLHLESRKNGVHIFSAGLFSFKPSNHHDLCSRKPIANKKSPNFLFEKELFTPIANPHDPTFLPQIPFLPPEDEKLPTNRPMVFPFLPNPLNPIPIPLLPPPSIIPPVIPSPPPSIIPPVFPSPPPSIIPPVFPSPSPPPSIIPPLIPGAPPFNLPPVPGLIPSPPPPPPPAFPIPLPPVPLVPVPGFPGVPPANEKSSEPKT